MKKFNSKKQMQFLLLSCASVLGSIAIAIAGIAHAGTYKVDAAHSAVNFSVKHMMISTVTGHFRDFSGAFQFDPKSGELQAADFAVKPESIDTGNAKRDTHLKSADFFDTAKCATAGMAKSKIKKTGEKTYDWSGDLTLHCATKPVTFSIEYVGSIKDPMGVNRVAFTAKSKINRKDWGLNWNKAIETGGVVVSDEVNIYLDIQAIEETKAASKAETKK